MEHAHVIWSQPTYARLESFQLPVESFRTEFTVIYLRNVTCCVAGSQITHPHLFVLVSLRCAVMLFIGWSGISYNWYASCPLNRYSCAF